MVRSVTEGEAPRSETLQLTLSTDGSEQSVTSLWFERGMAFYLILYRESEQDLLGMCMKRVMVSALAEGRQTENLIKKRALTVLTEVNSSTEASAWRGDKEDKSLTHRR